MDIGPRIKLARAKAQLTVRELGEKVGVSATAISKFERGEAAPRQSTLIRLARALSVGVEYFFREIRIEAVAPAYRKQAKIGARAQEAIEAEICDVVERNLTTEQLFPEDFFPKCSLPRFAVDTIGDTEKAADMVRSTWQLGRDPIDDLCGRLENCGVKVIALDGPHGFDGYSCWVNTDTPVIAFNTNLPGDRQRFNLAHELGHLVMELDPSLDPEKAAHRFAGAFLVPAEAAHSALGRARSNLSFEELLLLKKEFGVSVQTWMRRALDLNIITRETYTVLYKRLSARGWRTQEPGNVATEEPQRLHLLVYQALAENLITPSYAATLLGTGRKPDALRDVPVLNEPSENLIQMYSKDPELTAFVDADLDDLEDTTHADR